MKKSPTPRARIAWLLILALAFHIGFSLLRLPKQAYAKRQREIARFEKEGPVRYFLADHGEAGVRFLEWLRAKTPPDSVLLFRGDWRGAMEFVPALIYPRLLVEERAVPKGATEYKGRPIVHGPYSDFGPGTLVLRGRRVPAKSEVPGIEVEAR